MTKAIIFDFFGVLALKSVDSFRKTFFPYDPTRHQEAGKLADQLSLGVLGYDDYIKELAKLANIDRQTVLEYTEDFQANNELVDYIKRTLKPRYKIGIISNAGADWVKKILGEDIKLFNDIVLSYKVGTIKPDPEIYKISTQNLGVKPEECVFVDDIKTYCEGAENKGMKSVWYQDFAQMKTGLEQILAASADN